MDQIEMVSLESLVPQNHLYRQFHQLWHFNYVKKQLKRFEKDNPNKGYGMLRLFKCLLLQYLENLSDRELERYLIENTSAKWFAGFNLAEPTPDHTVFTKLRTRLGPQFLAKLFKDLRNQLKKQGFMNEVFSFVDASQLIAKATLWEERDQLIKEKIEKLNNKTLPKVAKDQAARIGCKGKNKYWYGFKKHVSVDMQSGLINKVAVTPANLSDGRGLKHVCPSSGAIYADKAYCTQKANQDALRKGCTLRAIKKNNMKGKNRDQDRWLSGIRAPYERVFSKQNKRVRYRGIAKNQFAEYMNAICFNLKRLAVLDPPNLVLN